MKINTQSKSTNTIWIVSISLIGLLAVGGALYYYLVYLPNYDPTSNYRPVYPVDKTETASKESSKSAATPESSRTSEEVPTTSVGSITINELYQKDGYVNVKAVVSNFSATSCVYSFVIDSGKPVVKEHNGTCAGLSISQDEFDKIGTYTITATAYSASEKLTATGTIDIR